MHIPGPVYIQNRGLPRNDYNEAQTIIFVIKSTAMLPPQFKTISPERLNENFFRLFNHDWMLVTAGKPGDYNTMTASWGSTGILWNKPIAICYIRPHRHTFLFAERFDYFTLSFFSEAYRDILNYCGSHSGRTVDKAERTGLLPLETTLGNVIFEQARLALECRKLYADFLNPDNFMDTDIEKKIYPSHDYHKFYIGEIMNCHQRL